MAMREVKHPKWGSNLQNQTAAHVWKGLGNRDQYMVTTEQYTGFFGRTKTREKTEHVGSGWVKTTDDDEVATRQYRHRCSLLKIVMTPGRNGPVFVAFFDGHVASDFVSSEIVFRIAPDDLKDNDGEPIAEVRFQGKGTRWGPLENYTASRLVATFANKNQMDKYLDVTNRRMPKSITHGGVTYSATSAGQYQSSDGSCLPFLLVMYFLLTANEQKAFAAENPEVQSLLGDPAQSSGALYDGGSQSGVVDFGGSGSSSTDIGSSITPDIVSSPSFDVGGGSF